MNKRILIVIFGALMLLGNTSFAQEMKIGYVNTQKLIEMMPETAKVDSALQEFARQLQEQQQSMMQELNDKRTSFIEAQEKGNLAQSVLESRQSEIQDLQRRVQNFQQTAQQDLSQKQQELYEPLIEKVENAIEKVAKDNNYRYVFESSTGNILYSVDEDNLLPLVKKELGL